MKFQRATILLPCHSLEDFPVHLLGDEAHELLVAWSALWHPAVMAALGAPPDWRRADDPPSELHDLIALVPGASRHELEPGWNDRAQQSAALVLEQFGSREKVVAQVFAAADTAPPEISADLVAEFWALAIAFLLVELLTRQMRYYSNLDEDRFRDEATKAAHAAVAGDENTVREQLQVCHDMLGESRNQFYPVDSYLIDLTLAAETTGGDALLASFDAAIPTNLMLSGSTLEQLAARAPAALASLRDAVEAKSVCLVGGEYVEEELPLQSLEQLLDNLERGRRVFEQQLAAVPKIYGRRRFGLSPALPLVLSRLGYAGALHATLDAGIFPAGSQAKTGWESHDGTTLDALACIPRDARMPESILSFPRTLGEAMDMHHVACVAFAHWPGHASVWYHDLRRAAKWGPALGKFVTLEEFFETSSMVDSSTRFEADEYVSPYLRQAVDAQRDNPISRPIELQHAAAETLLATGLETLATLAGAKPSAAVEPAESASADRVQARLDDLAEPLLGKNAGQPLGLLAVNPTGSPRRMNVQLSGFAGAPAVSDTIRAVDNQQRLEAVVDVPAMGFVYAPAAAAVRAAESVATAEENRLRNDFFEVVINRTTGSLQSIHLHGRRGNRLSQQLVLCGGERNHPAAQERQANSVMAADRVEVTAASAALGEITSQGRLVDYEGQHLADFTQVFRLWRGSRVLDMEIELQPAVELQADPWTSYFASRLAWRDESAILWRSHLGGAQPTLATRFDAPEFIEIRDAEGSVTLLTGGLAYHRKIGFRMLDTLLLVRGEQRRKFRMAVAVDLEHPAAAALALHHDAARLAMPAAGPASPRSAWLLHQDSKAVVATHWSVLFADGAPVGIRTRLLETEGRSAQVRLAAFRDFVVAHETDLAGNPLRELRLEAGQAPLSLAPHEWVQLEARWVGPAQDQERG
ncbi:MAG: hypothetical protein KDA42_06480 [Planctomycetales bacterium]|nr:hypothetical protein [Planctomycetales bacterium]